jgi:hypothetical protein
MATLLELDTIETNAMLEPSPGEPSEVTQARNLRRKIRMAALRAAEEIMDDDTDPSGNTAVLEQIAWARQTMSNPDSVALSLMRLALTDAPTSATVAQILGVSDAAVQTVVNKLLPRLAKGLQVTR